MTVTDASATYKGTAFAASATITPNDGSAGNTLQGIGITYDYYVGIGTSGTNLGSTAPRNIGTYTVVATFPGSPDYVTASSSTNFTISAEALTITAIASSRTYNGTTTAVVVPGITSGKVMSGDTAAFIETYSTKNVGTGLTLTPSGVVTDGNSGKNYTYTFILASSGVITAEALTVTAAASTKTYDGTTAATTAPAITSGTVMPGDTAGFSEIYSTRNVGTGLTLTPSGSVSDGNSGKDYTYTYIPTSSGTITAEALTVTAAANSKTYDGTTAAAAVPTITSGTVIPGDTAIFTETYSNKNAGTGLTLNPGGVVNDGDSGKDYTYTYIPVSTGVITAEALTVTAVASSKTYDGTTAATTAPTITSGTVMPGDTAAFIETYSTKNVGTGLALTPGGVVSDTNSGNNYTYTYVPISTGVITAEALTVTAAASTKTYDGTTAAAAVPTITSGTVMTGDTAMFTEIYSNKNAGTALPLNPGGLVSDANSGNNYTYTYVPASTGVITAEALTVTAAASTKTYDGTTAAAAVPTITSGTVMPGDTAMFTEIYSNKNAGTGLPLNPGGLVSDGNSGNNYTYTYVYMSTGVITAEALTVTAAASSKTYDGTTAATTAPAITSGTVMPGDTAGFTEAYSTKNVGSGLTLTPGGVVADGNSGKDYTYTYVSSSSGTITARALTVTAVTNTKPYDGTTSAAAVPTITTGSLAPGDSADFVEMYNLPNVGTGLTLTPSGTVSDGNSGNNYSYTFVPVSTGVITAPTASATLTTWDTTTEGNWQGVYGNQGYDIASGAVKIPSFATITPAGQTTYTWSTTSSDPRALQTPLSSNRVAAGWYSSSSFTIDVNLTDGQAHDIALYLLDWDKEGRVEQIQISSTATGAILDTETVSNFSNGVYLQWNVTGNVIITVTRQAGNNAIVSGVFIDPPSAPFPQASASFITKNTATEGNWEGVYGSQGYDIVGGAVSIPSYALVNPAGQSAYTWTTTSSDPRALETPNSSNRVAAVWYSGTSFTIDVNFIDGQAHDLALYALDWDSEGRAEQVQISSRQDRRDPGYRDHLQLLNRRLSPVEPHRKRGHHGHTASRQQRCRQWTVLRPDGHNRGREPVGCQRLRQR